MPRILLILLCSLTLLACGGEDPPAPSGQPPSASLIGRTLTIPAGEALRIGFEPFSGAARVIVTFEPADAQVDVCGMASLDAPAPDPSGCVRDVRSGVREPVVARDLAAVAVVVRGPQGITTDLVLEYEEGKRAITVELPVVPPPPGGADCSDNACNPFFELQPTRAGSFSASASWQGPDGVLVLLQGSVLGGAQTATGIPYAEPARREGSSPLSISAQLSAPAEYALALRHQRAGSTIPPMRDVVIEMTWPA